MEISKRVGEEAKEATENRKAGRSWTGSGLPVAEQQGSGGQGGRLGWTWNCLAGQAGLEPGGRAG